MRLKREFILRDIVGETILVPVGESTTSFNGLITMNEVGKFIWHNLSNVNSEEELVSLVLENYDIDKNIASVDVSEFLGQLKDADIIE